MHSVIHEAEVSESDIKVSQDVSTFGAGVTITKIKVTNSAGQFCYFDVEARINRHDKPVIRVTEINSGATKSKDITGTWKGHKRGLSR